MTKPKKPLAAYMRVSRVGDREERLRSPDLQREAIERYARAEGFSVEWFAPELDVSGSTRAQRPVLDQIIIGVKSGELGGLVVAKLDRLSRMRPKERVLLFEEIEEAGGVVLSAGEQLDPSTPEGRFARDVFLGVARMQWEKYREGFERAKESAVADGIPIQTRPAVGYRRAGRRLVLDEHAAPVVREVFERRALGEGPASLGAFLTARGVKTSQGSKTWSKQAVYGLLRNRVYLGELRYGLDGRFVNAAAHEPIVDLATWQAAQNPGRRKLSPTRTGTNLLAGLARCQACRYCLQGTTTSRGKRIYRCTKTHSGGLCPQPVRVVAEPVEEAVEQAFWALTADLEAEGAQGNPEEEREVQKALERAERALAQWSSPEMQEAIGDPVLYAEGFRERRAARDKAAEELGRVRAAGNLPRVGTETLRAAWKRMSTEERRELLALRFDTIALSRDTIVLYPAGSGPADLPRRGFKQVPALAPFPHPPDGARTLTL
jgi:site-specific DNA recombinase